MENLGVYMEVDFNGFRLKIKEYKIYDYIGLNLLL